MSLSEFLDNKPLYYAEIDYTRMPRAYASIQEDIKIPKIIHLVGTNGKGTTGRFIANALNALGLKVGHYSSPHIEKFNERIWLNGKNADDTFLEDAHERLQGLLSEEFKKGLSYFEYTTFLAMLVYEGCEYIVLEAGLGGEYDATNVFFKELSVITPIGMDHEDFLGSTLEEISLTKLKSVDKKAIIAKQSFEEVYAVASGLEAEFLEYETLLKEKDFVYAKELKEAFNFPSYLKENLLVAMSVLRFFGFEIKKELFNFPSLEGRMQKIGENVTLDVGHNKLAAQAIVKNFRDKSVNLVYNSYKDKDYLSILAVLEPIIKQVEIIAVEDKRIVLEEDLIGAIESLGLRYKKFTKIDKKEMYLVFGSFSVAEEFKKYI